MVEALHNVPGKILQQFKNWLLQDMKNFRDGKFYSIEEKMAESTSYCNSNLEIEGFILLR